MTRKQQTTEFTEKVVNLETNIDMQSWYRIWQPTGPVVSVQNKTSQQTQRSLQKFLEPDRKPEVIYTDNYLEFGKACEDLSWNHCTSTPHRSETKWYCRKSSAQSKGRHLCCIIAIRVWMKIGGQILWNVTPICETSQIYCLMGRRRMKDVLGNHRKDAIIPFGSLVEYHPISAKDQSRIHQFGKKVLPGLFLGYALFAGRIWKGDVLIADLEELETIDASEIYSKRLNQSGLDERGWADSTECYPMKDGSEYHLVARLFRLERWWNITPFLLKTSRDCISSVQKSRQVYSLDMRCTR